MARSPWVDSQSHEMTGAIHCCWMDLSEGSVGVSKVKYIVPSSNSAKEVAKHPSALAVMQNDSVLDSVMFVYLPWKGTQ
jgi:hypothetical protein